MAHYRVKQKFLEGLMSGGEEREKIMAQLVKTFSEAGFYFEVTEGDKVELSLRLDIVIDPSILEIGPPRIPARPEGPCRVSG